MVFRVTKRHGKGLALYLVAQYYASKTELEKPGVWLGKGTETLVECREGDRVTLHDLVKLTEAVSPRTGGSLVQNSGPERAVYDFTIDVPKVVSVWIALAPSSQERALREGVVRDAFVATVIPALEACAVTRRGSGGHRFESASTSFACFEHHVNRRLEPHTHYHVLATMVGLRTDGTTGALVSRPFYQAAREIDDLFQHELSRRLEPRREELDRIPKSLLDAFSTRRREILQEVGEGASATERQFAAYKTREAKSHQLDHDALSAKWRSVAQEHGYNPNRTHERSFDELFPELTPEEKARFQTTEPSHTASAQGTDRNSAFHRMADAAVAKIEEARSAIVTNVTTRLAHQLAPDTLIRFGVYNLKDPLRKPGFWEQETLREKAARLLSAESIARNLTFQPLLEDLTRNLGLDQEHGHER